MKFIILIICVTIVTIELLYLLFKKCELIIKNHHEIKLKEIEFSNKKEWEDIIKNNKSDKPSSLDMDRFYMATLLMKENDVKEISKDIDTVKKIYETLKRDVL